MVDYSMTGEQARQNIRAYFGVPANTPMKRWLQPLSVPLKQKHIDKGVLCDARNCMFSIALHEATGCIDQAVFATVTWLLLRDPRTGALTLYYLSTAKLARQMLRKHDADKKQELHAPVLVVFPAMSARKTLEIRRENDRRYRERIKKGEHTPIKRRRKATRGGGAKSELLTPRRPVAPSFTQRAA